LIEVSRHFRLQPRLQMAMQAFVTLCDAITMRRPAFALRAVA
jgi:hypothetical protein